MILKSNAQGRLAGGVVTFVSVTVFAIGAAMMPQPWGGLYLASIWPLGDLWARHMSARLVVTASHLRLPSFWHDNRWNTEDVEAVAIGVNGELMIMDRSGQFAQSLLCTIPRRDRAEWDAALTSMGYRVIGAVGKGRWRPSEPRRMERRLARPTALRVFIALVFAFEVAFAWGVA